MFHVGVLKNFAKFTDKHLCQSLFSNKVADLRPLENFFYRTHPVVASNFLQSIVFAALCFHWISTTTAMVWETVLSNQSHLFNTIPTIRGEYGTIDIVTIPQLSNVFFFRNSFFPSTLIEWDNIDKNFSVSVLKFKRASTSNTFNCLIPKRINSFTRLGLSHLQDHKFNQELGTGGVLKRKWS